MPYHHDNNYHNNNYDSTAYYNYHNYNDDSATYYIYHHNYNAGTYEYYYYYHRYRNNHSIELDGNRVESFRVTAIVDRSAVYIKKTIYDMSEIRY